jgi:acetylornithine aminotransferase
MTSLMNTYGQRELTLTRGVGTRVWDRDGKEYLDALSGIAVCGLGHAHPAVSQAIADQAATLMHVSNLYNIPQQQSLADTLCRLSGMSQVFFSNSGAEANEAALKIARKFGNDKGINTPTVIVMNNSFHGRTMATLSATGNPKVQAGFAPLVEGFIHVPFDDIEAVKALAESHDNIVAILVEPVQGEGGVHIPASNYLNDLREICDQHQWLLMLDEIQTGNGRTGRYFACQHNDILPDVMTTAKGLANGAPIGACLVRGAAMNVLQPGNHGSTFGGNPLSCAAGLAVLNELETHNYPQRAAELGALIVQKLKHNLSDCDLISDIRGLGLMIGIELKKDCGELVKQAQDQGLLINVTAQNTIRLLPPLIMSDEDLEQMLNILCPLIKNF